MKANMSYEMLRNSMTVQDAVRVLKETNCYGSMDIAKTVILKALEEHQYYKDLAESYEKTINKLTKAIAEQQPKVGHWIGHRWVNGKEEEYIVPIENGVVRESCICSECKEWLVGSDEYGCGGRYCPNCGAKMQEEEK